jgi:ribosome-associated toxin RatA of RatAB toxin-antitoxin module
MVLVLGWMLSTTVHASEPAAGPEVRAGSVPEPGSKVRWGRSEAILDAPLAQVRSVVQDYGKYYEFLPHFEKSKVLSERGDTALVYMQAKVAHGAVTIWAQLKMKQHLEADGTEVVEAHMLKGNVDRMSARWELMPLADGRTRVTFKMLLDPDLPLPSALVSSENVKATRLTLTALHARLAKTRGGAAPQ